MEIGHKFEFVEGNFDTETGELVCVRKDKYAEVTLCFKENMISLLPGSGFIQKIVLAMQKK